MQRVYFFMLITEHYYSKIYKKMKLPNISKKILLFFIYLLYNPNIMFIFAS
jgi:hypothetical protein